MGIVLSMESDVHAEDPCPEFPAWLAGAEVVTELAQLAAREEQAGTEVPVSTVERWRETAWSPIGSS